MSLLSLPPDLIRYLCDHINAKTLYALAFAGKHFATICTEERYKQRCFQRLLVDTTSVNYDITGYKYGNIIRRLSPDGKRNGKAIWLTNDGFIYYIEEYKDNRLHGMSERWSRDTYAPIYSGYYRDGLKEGIHRYWWYTEDINELRPREFIEYTNDRWIANTYYDYDGIFIRREQS